MNYYKNHRENIKTLIKYIFITILIAIPFSFIDMPMAIYAGAISISIIFIRLAIQRLKPGHINGYKTLHGGNELNVPESVEVFELSDSATMEILYEYLGVLRTLAIHPKILILRFNKITQINPSEVRVLNEVINQLSENGTAIYFSDVDTNIETQFKEYDFMQKVEKNKIFSKIEDALKCANETLE